MDSLIATQLLESIQNMAGVRLNAFSVHMCETFDKLVELIERSQTKVHLFYFIIFLSSCHFFFFCIHICYCLCPLSVAFRKLIILLCRSVQLLK